LTVVSCRGQFTVHRGTPGRSVREAPANNEAANGSKRDPRDRPSIACSL
jgi:hypothetical protein